MNLNTIGAPSAEEVEKVAEMQLFAKLASDQGIDLGQFSDEEVVALYNHTFNKVAEDGEQPDEAKKEDEDEEKKEDEKKEAAAREHAEKLAAAREEARADELGRKMASAYVDELNKRGLALREKEASEAGAGESELDKAASRLSSALAKVKHAPEIVGGKVRKMVGDMPAGKAAREATAGRTKMVGAATLGAAGAAAAGGAAAMRGKKKEASALNEAALEVAVKIAHEAGFDPDEAATRVLAVHTLGLGESEKVAQDLDTQLYIRGLEYLEAAGYPVSWDQ